MESQRSNTAQGATASTERPWLGLQSFTEETRDYFFGRTRQARELFQRVTAMPLTVLYGRSGLGKTSLLGAGLLPALRAAGLAPQLLRLRLDDNAPTLLDQLHDAWRGATGTVAPVQGSLWEQLHRRDLTQAAAPVPVLLLDQFEELFTFGWARRRAEVDALMLALADVVENREPAQLRTRFYAEPALLEQFHFEPGALRVLLSLREDYLAQLESYKTLMPALMRNRVALSELDGHSALDAVLRPGQLGRAGIVAADVARAIVCFVARRPPDTELQQIEAVPPLLSLLCTELNDMRLAQEPPQPQITAAQLAAQGDDILQRFYERSFADLPQGVRRVVEDLLIDNGGRYRESSSRETVVDEMRRAGVEQPEACLDQLIERRLLTAELRDRTQRIELTHDLLVPLAANSREIREQEDRQLRERQVDSERRRVAEAEARAVRREIEIARQADAQHLSLLRDAADRAFGRAIQANEKSDTSAYPAYLEESLGYFGRPTALMAAAALLQQRAMMETGRTLAHDKPVLSARFSPVGTHVVTASADGTARIWDTSSGLQSGPPLKHPKTVVSAQFSHDGKRVLTGCIDKAVRIWDTRTGLLIGVPMHHLAVLWSVKLNPAGDTLVTTSADRRVHLWDSHTGQPIGKPLQHPAEVYSARFSLDGRLIVTACADGAARLLDGLTGELIGDPMLHAKAVRSARFSMDSTRVVTASDDMTAAIWSASSGLPVGGPFQHRSAVYSARFSPDGLHVVTASSDHAAYVWDARTGTPVGEPLRHKAKVGSIRFSPDSTRIVTASEDHTARIWDALSGKLIGEPLRHDEPVRSARFSPDGMRVATASDDMAAQLWSARTGAPAGGPLQHGNRVRLARFSPDGMYLLTASADRTARLWDVRSGKPVGTTLRHRPDTLFTQLSDDFSILLTIDSAHCARLWRLRTGELIGEPMRHARRVTAARFNASGTHLLTVTIDRIARLWKITTGELSTGTLHNDGGLRSIRFSRDGASLVTVGLDGTVRIWSTHTGTQRDRPLHHQNSVLTARFGQDGQAIVTTGIDKTARVWDVGTGTQIGEPMVHARALRSARIAADGASVVTTSAGDVAYVWSRHSSFATSLPLRHRGLVRSARFSPDGHYVVTASGDHTARIWDARSGELACQHMRHRQAVLSVRYSPDGTRVVTACADRTVQIWDTRTGFPISEGAPHQSVLVSARFNADGTEIMALGGDGGICVWDAHPHLGSKQRLRAAIRALSAMEVSQDGRIRMLSVGAASLAREQLVHTSGPAQQVAEGANQGDASEVLAGVGVDMSTTQHDAISFVVAWHLADRSARTVSPFSHMGVQQFIDAAIAWALETGEGQRMSCRLALEEAYALDPGHSLILAAMSVFEEQPQTRNLWRQLTLDRIRQDARMASRAAGIFRRCGDRLFALQAANIALRLEPQDSAMHDVRDWAATQPSWRGRTGAHEP